MEQFKPPKVDKNDLRVSGEVRHFETAPKGSQEDRAFLEKAITSSDDAVREERIVVLDRLFNLAGMRATWIDELDTVGMETLNSIVDRYLAAEKGGASVSERNSIQREFERLFG